MNAERPEQSLRDPLAELERGLIDEFLRRRGYDPATIHTLAEDQLEALMKEASLYASVKLTEVETRAHYVGELHHAADPVPARPGRRAGGAV